MGWPDLNAAERADLRAQAKAYLATARAAAGTGPEWPSGAAAVPAVVGVVGAGTMGSGIALAAARAGSHTCLIDASPEALARAQQRIRYSLDQAVARQRMGADAAEATWSRLHTATDLQRLADADAVIEAVYEDQALKEGLMAELGRICAPRAWLASNTSTLDIDRMAQASGRPAQVVGTHFLTPAHVVPLVEVVRGAQTHPHTLGQAAAWVRSLGKVPVQTRNAWGFIGNRLFESYLQQADALVLAGVSPQRVDTALEAFGMAMGPCRTVDMAGLDIADQVIRQRHLQLPGGYPEQHRAVTRRLAALGRLGVKTGRGHYRYEGHQALPDPDLAEAVRQWAADLGVPSLEVDDVAIVQRCVQPLMAEGQRVLQEGVACRAEDIDLVWVLGYGFPAALGGPMFLARALGL